MKISKEKIIKHINRFPYVGLQILIGAWAIVWLWHGIKGGFIGFSSFESLILGILGLPLFLITTQLSKRQIERFTSPKNTKIIRILIGLGLIGATIYLITGTTIILRPYPQHIQKGTPLRIDGQLFYKGKPLGNREVTLEISSYVFHTKTNLDGHFSFKIETATLSEGVHEFNVSSRTENIYGMVEIITNSSEIKNGTLKFEDGRLCNSSLQCESENCRNAICCEYGKICCIKDDMCPKNYFCGEEYFCEKESSLDFEEIAPEVIILAVGIIGLIYKKIKAKSGK